MIHISVYLGHKEHGSRRWPEVPRIGETMLVNISAQLHYLKVVDVQWGITQDSRTGFTGDCEVAVFCRLPKKKAR